MRILHIIFLFLLGIYPIGLVCGQTPDDFNANANGGVISFAVQADGKILAAGNFTTINGVVRSRICRFSSDGSLDTSFNPDADSSVLSLVAQADGKILVGGGFNTIGGVVRNQIARLHTDGRVDLAFKSNLNNYVETIALHPDGTILVGGNFTTVAGVARIGIARLHADGTLDTAFSPNANGRVGSLAIQADGKIVMSGNFTSVGGVARNRIARLNADGTLDTSFDPNPNSLVNAIALQADGKILIGGTFTAVGGVVRNRIARLNDDGTLDGTFDPNADSIVHSLVLQADDKIVIGGRFNFVGGEVRNRIARINPDGTLDGAFDPNADGIVNSLAVQTDGKIIAGGDFMNVDGLARNRIARLTNNITATQTLTVTGGDQIDWTRGGSSPEVENVTVDSWNGSAWVSLGPATRVTGGWRKTGTSLPASSWVRARGFSRSGAKNGSGWMVEQIASYGGGAFPDIVVALEGESLVSGVGSPGFGTQDVATTNPSTKTLTITNAGDAPLVGLGLSFIGENPADFVAGPLDSTTLAPGASVSFTVTFSPLGEGARRAVLDISSSDADESPFQISVNGNGLHWDPLFNPDVNGYVDAIAVQPDGRILIKGEFTTVNGVTRSRIARLNADGTLDNPFHPVANNLIRSMALQLDGRILISGDFTTVNGVARNRIARLNADGTLDASFDPNANSAVNFLGLMVDGRILVDGAFSTVGGLPCDGPARLNPDGTLDDSFDADVVGTVRAFAEQSDGRILVGYFHTLGPTPPVGIARLNVDGTTDNSFVPNVNGRVDCIALHADGRIIIGGEFTSVGGVTRNRIARLNDDGTLDSTFDPNPNNTVLSLALQADGRILMAGNFDRVSELPRNRIARLNADGTPDASFNPNASNPVYSVALLPDGKILAGGQFTSLGGVERNRLARLPNNYPATQILTVTGTSQIDWTRGGSAPEVGTVTFESWEGGAWVNQGPASRVAGGWRKSELILPAESLVRARGFASGGLWIEQITAYDAGGFPDISVEGHGQEIVNGDLTPDPADGTDLGSAPVESGSTASTFTIRNIGVKVLNLTNPAPDFVNVTGSSAFSVTMQPDAASIAAGGGTRTFEITFDPATSGPHSAIVTISSNDENEHPFTFALEGTGLTPTQAVVVSAITAAGLNGAHADLDATPFNDGVENRIKYAFNMNLAGPDTATMEEGGTSGQPLIAPTESGPTTIFRYEFLRRIDSGLIYTPQKNTSLAPDGWVDLTSTPTIISINDSWERVIHEEPVDPEIASKYYGRVGVSIP